MYSCLVFTCSGIIPALSTAACMAIEPNLVAGREDRLPLKLPMGVLTALAITMSLALL